MKKFKVKDGIKLQKKIAYPWYLKAYPLPLVNICLPPSFAIHFLENKILDNLNAQYLTVQHLNPYHLTLKQQHHYSEMHKRQWKIAIRFPSVA